MINSHKVTKHACTSSCPLNTPHIPSNYSNEQTTKETKAINNSYIYIYISHVNVTQTVPDISPLMPMHQDPLLVGAIQALYKQLVDAMASDLAPVPLMTFWSNSNFEEINCCCSRFIGKFISSQWYVAHAKTEQLSWYVQNFIVTRMTGGEMWTSIFKLNLMFDWTFLSGMGTRWPYLANVYCTGMYMAAGISDEGGCLYIECILMNRARNLYGYMCTCVVGVCADRQKNNFGLLTQQCVFIRFIKGCKDEPPSIKHYLWEAINFVLHTKYVKYEYFGHCVCVVCACNMHLMMPLFALVFYIFVLVYSVSCL